MVLVLFVLFVSTPPVLAELEIGEVTAISVAIETIEIEGQEDYVLPPGTDGQLTAKTLPGDLQQEVHWAVIEQSDGLELELNRSTGLLVVSENSGQGWITVQASAEGCPPKTQRIEINCGCLGESGTCDSTIGAGQVLNGSVDVRLSLGKAAEGRTAGDLFLHAEEPLAVLSTPEALVINSSSAQVAPFYQNGLLEQIVTPQALVNFIRYSPLKYEVHFYDITFRGRKLKDGAYNLDPTATPLSVWCIENPDKSGKNVNQLAVTEIRGGKEREFHYAYEASANEWSLVSGNGLKIESKAEATNAAGDKVVRSTVAGPDGKPVRVEETTYHEFAFGEKRIRETIDPDGVKLTTDYRYQTEVGPGYGKLVARMDADGSWVRYGYDDKGRIVKQVRPFLDAPLDSPDEKAVVVEKDYTPVDKADRYADNDRHRPRQVIKRINGIETSRTYHAYIRHGDGSRTEIVERCARQGSPYGHPANLRMVRTYFSNKGDGPEAGKIKSRLSEEGLLSTYTYENGQFQLSPSPAKCRFIPGKGKATRTTVTHGTEQYPEGIPYQTTRKTTITDAMGREKLSEAYVRTEEGFARIDWRFYTHDRLGRAIETLKANDTRTESVWDCCGKSSETNIEGNATRYTYNDLKRVTSRTNEATGVVTSFTYDAVGRRLTTTKGKNDLSLTRESRYDAAGRLVEQINVSGLATRYTQAGLVFTTTQPGGASEITTRHLDGKTRSVTGTAVVHRFYRYGVNPDGSQWTMVLTGSKGSPRWEKTTRDLLGRVVRVEKPGFEGIETAVNTYDAKGRLIKTETPGRAATLYQYDALGNQVMTGLDVDGDGKLAPASMDRITARKTGFKMIDDAWWRESVQSLFAHDNQDKETVVSTQRKRLTGWKDRVIDERVAIDIHGNETRTVVTLDRFKRTRTQTVYSPDSEVPASTVQIDGRLAATTSKTGITTTFGYDALGRRIAAADPRKGISMLHYDNAGRLDYVQDAAGNRIRYEYNPATGRKSAEFNALNKATRYQYNARGQLIRTWGDVPYPVEYQYDSYGQMILMRTFRDGTGWNGATWPKDTGIGDPTIWRYQPSTGLLLAKEDAKGHQTRYAYGVNGALATRTWARLKKGKPLQTFYRYDPATGHLTKIDYSDETPDIAFAYDRLGRKVRVSDAAGVHNYGYNDKLQLVTEGLTGQQIYQIKRQYDELGRAAGFRLDDGYAVTYGYDGRGRFETVDWQINDQVGDVAYRYLNQSDRLAGMESTSGLSVQYEYEPNRDVKTAVVNKFKDRLISKYGYQYDPIGRRINVKNSGEAFKEEGFWLYGYNDRNELISASKFMGSDLKDQTKPLLGLESVYNYDPIGNRVDAFEGVNKVEYLTNELNQYEKISGKKHQDEGLLYDEDGNLIEDDEFNYSWNGECRLVEIKPKNSMAKFKKLKLSYDYKGRRIWKKVYTHNDVSDDFIDTRYFHYDGWNLVREKRERTGVAFDKFYAWGLDLSRSLKGAGGIGGLLLSIENILLYKYVYDARGNVGQVVKRDNGVIVSNYRYDAFGTTYTLDGVFPLENSFKFSSKYIDSEVNHLYFGHRYYSLKYKKWLNRDPFDSINLYGYNHNDPINRIDVLGLYDYKVTLDDIKHYLITNHDLSPETALQKYQAFPVETREWIDNEIKKQKGTPEITEIFNSTDFDGGLTPYIVIPQNGKEAILPQKGFWMCKEELIGDKIIGPLHHRFIVKDGTGFGYEKATHFLWSNPGTTRVENDLKPRKDVRCYELKCLLPECASKLLEMFIENTDGTIYNLGYRDCQSWANSFAFAAYQECEDKCCSEEKPNRSFIKKTGW